MAKEVSLVGYSFTLQGKLQEKQLFRFLYFPLNIS